MFEVWRRFAPYILAGFLVLNLIEAIQDGERDNWIIVGIMALALAFVLWQRRRTPPQ